MSLIDIAGSTIVAAIVFYGAAIAFGAWAWRESK